MSNPVGVVPVPSSAQVEFVNQVWDKAVQLAKLPKTVQAIPVPKFCQAYLSCLSIPFTEIDLACLVVIFSDYGEQEEQLPLVSKRQFDLFLLRFGPPNKSLQKINNVLVNGKIWFHGSQGREPSERLLREKPKEGLFLLRYSSVPGAFTVDYIKKQKICRFNNIRNDPTGGVEVVVGRPPRQQAYKYSTMDTFITKNAHIFQRPALNARSHFQWLKLRIPAAGLKTSGAAGANNNQNDSSSDETPKDNIPGVDQNSTPEEKLAAAIQHSYRTDKTVLSAKGFGLTGALPPQVCVLKFLISLDLSKNKLTQIPPRLCALKDLETLVLSQNNITEIPGAALQGLNRLSNFQCSENQLADLPNEFWNLTALTFVDLSVNKLKRLNDGISKLVSLQFLDVSSNELESLPNLKENQEIEEMMVGSNRLREIPKEIASLPNMILVDVSNNLIERIPDEIISRLKEETSDFTVDVTGNKNLNPGDLNKMKTVLENKKHSGSGSAGINSSSGSSSSGASTSGPGARNAKGQGHSLIGGMTSSMGPGEGEPKQDILGIFSGYNLNNETEASTEILATDNEVELDSDRPPARNPDQHWENMWKITGRDYKLEDLEIGKKSITDASDYLIREYSNKQDYRKYFYQHTVHTNIIGDEKNYGPICVSIQKEPETTTTTDDQNMLMAGAGTVGAQAGQIAGGAFMEGIARGKFYRVLVRSKQHDRAANMPASMIKMRRREKYARSDDLLAALKKMFTPFSTKNLYVIRDQRSHKVFADLESKLTSNSSKFGVLCALEGQGETEMYNNLSDALPPGFEEFLDLISYKIDMLNWKRYKGDFSVKVSQISRFTEHRGHEIMLHVSNYIRYQEVTDAAKQQWERKRFLGNDIVLIVYYDGKTPLDPSTFVSNFNHVFALVQPVNIGGKMHYRLHMAYKYGVDKSHPYLPEDPIFPKEQFRDVFLTKLVNAERCAMSAPQFRKTQERVRAELFTNLQKEFPKKSRRAQDGEDAGYITTSQLDKIIPKGGGPRPGTAGGAVGGMTSAGKK
eukprot:TRINITY_DN25951_c0_g1_i2.p1 TRINITY_DN25951_c0_g1~~TRINITY_DN25951_c0_g1_i2.p1  ORF type:complete len:1030 (-),score=224.70 TRINITY_DN25951_c0_g1_i2:18-3107(-)